MNQAERYWEARWRDEKAVNDSMRRTLEAIVIRCDEGDKKSDWLPIISRLAKEALALEI